jgi:LPXTG-motif cell wall-anchored protein
VKKKILAILLVALGTAALVYRSVNYPGRSQRAKIGPVEIAVERQITIPVWAGVIAIAVGTGLLAMRRRK